MTVVKGGKKVLDDLTLKVYEGENVAILGPNGAGKSSLIKSITREYYPLTIEGPSSFMIWGRHQWDVFDLRFLLGIVSNDLQLTCARDITGLELVLSGFFGSIGLYKESITPRMRNKAWTIMKFLEIEHLKERNMNAMSSGEARRCLIARALVHDPKALILDEPTTSLDLHALHKFIGLLRKIAKSGTSIILVTQNLQDIFPEINRVILVKKGRITREGKKAEMLTSANMSRLFDTPLHIIRRKGVYYALKR